MNLVKIEIQWPWVLLLDILKKKRWEINIHGDIRGRKKKEAV
jgi:hypothetical protein